MSLTVAVSEFPELVRSL